MYIFLLSGSEENPEELLPNTVTESGFDRKLPTVMFIHGYGGGHLKPAAQTIKNGWWIIEVLVRWKIIFYFSRVECEEHKFNFGGSHPVQLSVPVPVGQFPRHWENLRRFD